MLYTYKGWRFMTNLCGSSSFQVKIYDADSKGRVKIRSLFNYMQSTADDHSKSLGTAMENMADFNLTWVYARFFINIFEYPKLYNSIVCTTWRSGVTDGMVNREFIMEDGYGKVFLKATSSLALIDKVSRKPVAIPEFISRDFERTRGRALLYNNVKFPAVEAYDHEYNLTVRYEDTDINNHLNNASYGQFVFESGYSYFKGSRIMSAMDIFFKHEVFYNENLYCRLKSVSSLSEGSSLFHNIFSSERGKAVAYAFTQWIEDF